MRPLLLLLVWALAACSPDDSSRGKILNVSYDATRELYREYDPLFVEHYRKQTGQIVVVRQSHGGSGKQGRAVMDGLPADVVTLALSRDIDAIANRAGLLPRSWQTRFPRRSVPFFSTIVLLVRKGNPKRIVDFDDLARSDVSVIMPNPKTSGGACWNYLAIWGSQSPTRAREVVQKAYANVRVLDSGARGSTTTFIERDMGDVLVTWESEALLVVNDLGRDDFEIVMPKKSIIAEPPVAVVDSVVDKHGTRAVAQEYLGYLYSPEAQELAARHHFRPSDPAVFERHRDEFREIELFDVDRTFGGWQAADAAHFASGQVFDQIFGAR